MKISNDIHTKVKDGNIVQLRPGFHLALMMYEPISLSESIYNHLRDQLSNISLIKMDDYEVNLEFSPESDQDTGNVFEIWIYYNNALLVTCKYLHELQNIYFSILKKELIINFDEINLNLHNPF